MKTPVIKTKKQAVQLNCLFSYNNIIQYPVMRRNLLRLCEP